MVAQVEPRKDASAPGTVPVGVEASPDALRKVSFHHPGEPEMERALEATRRAFAESPASGGFAIHHYAAYRRWPGLD